MEAQTRAELAARGLGAALRVTWGSSLRDLGRPGGLGSAGLALPRGVWVRQAWHHSSTLTVAGCAEVPASSAAAALGIRATEPLPFSGG